MVDVHPRERGRLAEPDLLVTKPYIDGKWVDGSAPPVRVDDPYTLEVFSEVAAVGPGEALMRRHPAVLAKEGAAATRDAAPRSDTRPRLPALSARLGATQRGPTSKATAPLTPTLLSLSDLRD